MPPIPVFPGPVVPGHRLSIFKRLIHSEGWEPSNLCFFFENSAELGHHCRPTSDIFLYNFLLQLFAATASPGS